MSDVLELTGADFDATVLQETRPVLVDFYGPSCGPCRLLAPVIALLAKANADKAVFAKVDIAANSEVAAKYQISSMPTILVFKNGEIVSRLVGVQKQAKLQQLIDDNL